DRRRGRSGRCRRRRRTRERHRGAGRLAGCAAADTAHHVGVRAQVAQIRPVALSGSKREAVAAHQVRHLTLADDGVREQTDQVRLAQRLGPLGGEQHRQGDPEQTADRAFHGRAHLERSNRRSTASTSEYSERSRALRTESRAPASSLRAALYDVQRSSRSTRPRARSAHAILRPSNRRARRSKAPTASATVSAMRSTRSRGEGAATEPVLTGPRPEASAWYTLNNTAPANRPSAAYPASRATRATRCCRAGEGAAPGTDSSTSSGNRRRGWTSSRGFDTRSDVKIDSSVR